MADKTYKQMEKDFRELYFQKIKPLLAENEKRRKNNLLNLFIGLATFFSFLLAIACVVLEKYDFACLFFAIFVIAIIYTTLTNKVTKQKDGSYYVEVDANADFETEIKKTLMNDFLNIFADSSEWTNAGLNTVHPRKVQEYERSNIFNRFRDIFLDDAIKFVFKDIKVDVSEISTKKLLAQKFIILFSVVFIWPLILVGLIFLLFALIAGGSKFLLLVLVLALVGVKIMKSFAPFKGLVIEFDMNKSFNGHTIFIDKSEAGKSVPVDNSKFNKIDLESVEFNKKYSVYSTDQIEARYLLTSSMIERLLNLEFAFNAKYIRGSFKDNKLLLIIHTNRDMLEMGSNFKETKLDTFTNLFEEIVSILKIVDQLKLDEKTGL